MRYSSFISYNHRDKRWAEWLHQALEKYVVPKHLRGRMAPFGPIGARLPPVFRDREELASSADLAAAVRAALAQAATLVVVCSPNSARSKWVNQEVETFIATGRRDRVLCVIVAGEPGSGDPATECLPRALLNYEGAEPLAADARKGGDGKSLAKLKLLAGILDLPFDELRQREAQRRQRRLALLAVASTSGLVATSALAIFAMISRSEAIEQRRIAEERTLTAERTLEFVKSMFRSSDPSEARGEAMTAREVVDRGASLLNAGLNDQPTVKAELGVTLAEVYGALGLYHRGESLIRQSLALKQARPATSARQYAALGESQFQLGEYHAALAAFYQAAKVAPRQGENALLSRILVGFGQVQSAIGDEAAADRALEGALRIDVARGTAGRADVARDLEAIAVNRYFARQLVQAEQLAARALRIRLQLEGPASPSVADNRNLLANIAYERGQLARAEALYRENLAWDERVLGSRHPDLAGTLNNLGRVLLDQREFGDATALLERALEINLRGRGATHDDMAFLFANLATARRHTGRLDEAEELFRRSIAVAELHDHEMLGPSLTDLAEIDCMRGRTSEGIARLRRARPITVDHYPDDAWRSAWVDNVMGGCLLRAGRTEEGLQLIATSSETIAKRWGQGSLIGSASARRHLAPR